MKTIISAVAIAGLFGLSACNTTAIREKDQALLVQQHVIDSMSTEIAKKKAIDSMNETTRTQYVLPQNTLPTVKYVSQTPKVIYVHQARSRSYASYRSNSASRNNTYAAPVVYRQAPVKQRRGWSAKAKGAVIGGAGGAIAGAVINGRNRPVGALIGGLIGAGTGTGIGAIIDHRNGR